MAGPIGAHVRANGIRQHYLRFGAGEPLIVLPGITSPAVTWGFVGERLGARFETFVLDLRGRGLSAADPDLDYGIDAHADDVAAFAAAMGLARYHVLGHSLGARIAIRLARRHGAGIVSLLLADPPVSGPGRRPYVKTLAFYLEPIAEAVAGRYTVEAARRTYPGWTEAQVRARAEWLHTCAPQAIAANHRGFLEDDVLADLPVLTARTLLLVAERGGVIEPSDVAEIRALAPAIRVEWLKDSGHMMPFDQLEGFLAACLGFLGADD